MKLVVTSGTFSPARVLATGLALCIFIFGIVACGGGGGGGVAATPPSGGGGGGGGGTPPPAGLFMYAFLPGASPSTTYSVTGFSVDTTTGALSAVPSASLATTSVPNGTCGTSGCQTQGGTYYPDSILYLASDADNKIRPFTLNLSTGALTEQTTATYTYSGFLTTANSSGRAVQSHVPNVLYISPSTAQTNGTATIDAFSVNSSTGALSALIGTTVSSSTHVGVVTTPSYTVAAACGGTNCSTFTTYAINSDGSTGAQNGTTSVIGNAFSLYSNGNSSFLLSTDGTKIYAYPISAAGVGTTPGVTTNIGGLSGAGTTPNCQNNPTSQSNVVVLSCSSSNNGTTPTYVQGFSINASGVMTPGSGTFSYTNTYGNNLTFDNSGKYFFTQSGTTSINTEYSIDGSGNIGTVTGTTLTGYIAMPPVGEFLYLQNNGTVTPYQINSSNGSLTVGTTQALPGSGSGNQMFLFGGSSVQSYIPLGN